MTLNDIESRSVETVSDPTPDTSSMSDSALAEAAGAAGVLLDVHEAPVARSDDVENGHSTQEKSRLTNKAAFKP